MKRIQILLVALSAIAFGEKLNIHTDCENNICATRETLLESFVQRKRASGIGV
jgi:hypothetical protein